MATKAEQRFAKVARQIEEAAAKAKAEAREFADEVDDVVAGVSTWADENANELADKMDVEPDHLRRWIRIGLIAIAVVGVFAVIAQCSAS